MAGRLKVYTKYYKNKRGVNAFIEHINPPTTMKVLLPGFKNLYPEKMFEVKRKFISRVLLGTALVLSSFFYNKTELSKALALEILGQLLQT